MGNGSRIAGQCRRGSSHCAMGNGSPAAKCSTQIPIGRLPLLHLSCAKQSQTFRSSAAYCQRRWRPCRCLSHCLTHRGAAKSKIVLLPPHGSRACGSTMPNASRQRRSSSPCAKTAQAFAKRGSCSPCRPAGISNHSCQTCCGQSQVVPLLGKRASCQPPCRTLTSRSPRSTNSRVGGANQKADLIGSAAILMGTWHVCCRLAQAQSWCSADRAAADRQPPSRGRVACDCSKMAVCNQLAP